MNPFSNFYAMCSDHLPTVEQMVQSLLNDYLNDYLSGQRAKIDSIAQSQAKLQKRMAEIGGQVTDLSTKIDAAGDFSQSLCPFFLGFTAAVGVVLVTILVLLILVKVSQTKNASRQKKFEDAENQHAVELQEKQAELNAQLKTFENNTQIRLDQIQQQARAPMDAEQIDQAIPQAQDLQLEQTFLRAANDAVKNNRNGYFGKDRALQEQFDICYFNRVDPRGTAKRCMVEADTDTQAFFCGTVINGQLLLIPNHKNQYRGNSCALEFFDYPNGHDRDTINQIVKYATLSYDRSSGYWNIQTKGSIN